MIKRFIGVAALAVVIGIGIFVFVLTRDGELITPQGEGVVALESGTFEAFPLPDYSAAALSPEYKSYFVEAEPGIKLHVLEVGTGYPVYLQHGNPTSGWLYRKVAEQLPLDRFRLIMPTMVGLGFSSKVPASQHTLENHIRWTGEVLRQLDIEQAIYVGQDWGGPVGMGVLARAPETMTGAVVMNTTFRAPKEERALSTMHETVSTPILGEILTEGIGSVFDSLPTIQGDPDSMGPEVVDLYARPVNESGNAKAPLALMRMVPASPDHPSTPQLQEIEDYVATLDIPAVLVWGTEDPILGPALESMKEQFPNAPVVETNAGHFLQEEVPFDIAAAIQEVHGQIEATASETEGNQ